MSERLISRMLGPVARSVGNMLARGTVVLANSAGKMQALQIRLLSGEAKDGVEHFEPYGFTSHPLSGAEHVTLFFGGDRSHGVTIVVADRRYRLNGLAGGEVALHDDLGHQVHLTRAGIVIRGAGHPVVVTGTSKLRVEADIEATGQIKDLCDAAGKTMSGMRDAYNSHTHPGDSGGTTGTPNQVM